MNRLGAVLAALLLPGPLTGQAQVQLTAGWRVAIERTRVRSVHPTLGPTSELATGFALGGEATATRGRFALRARYGQGNLSPDAGDDPLRRFAEAELLVGVRAAPWLAFWMGPHARSYRTEVNVWRWLFWEGRANARGTVLEGRLTSFFEAWRAFDGSVNVQGPFTSSGGAEGGLELQITGPALTWRLSYRIEQSRLSGGDHRETTESLALGVLLDVLK